MIILLLSSILLITLDLRGNAVFNAARSGFGYALRPFEIAGDVITRPAERAWRGMTEYDDLLAKNEQLQRQVDAQRSAEIAAENALAENRDLRAQLNLESLADYDKVTASIIGLSPSNFDQQVEIDSGSLAGIRVGMPVVNDAGLVGKITRVAPQTSIVMLVTHPSYHVPVKVVAEVLPTPSTTVPASVPSGLAVEDVTTTSSTSSTTSSTTSTTVPGSGSASGSAANTPSNTTSTTSSSTSTTTTTVVIEVTRETGALNGFGAERLPRVRFIADSPLFGVVVEGDAVLTAGGSESLAPPNIPIGRVANVMRRLGIEGLELEVELSADLDHLAFLTVILYQPSTELVTG